MPGLSSGGEVPGQQAGQTAVDGLVVALGQIQGGDQQVDQVRQTLAIPADDVGADVGQPDGADQQGIRFWRSSNTVSLMVVALLVIAMRSGAASA